MLVPWIGHIVWLFFSCLFYFTLPYLWTLYEPRLEKTGFLHMRKQKTQISFAVTAKLISAFVFATHIVKSLFYLNPKFQASSHLLWQYSPVCVGPGRKPRRPVFSQGGSYLVTIWLRDSHFLAYIYHHVHLQLIRLASFLFFNAKYFILIYE